MNNFTKYQTTHDTILFYDEENNKSFLLPVGFSDKQYEKLLKVSMYNNGIILYTRRGETRLCYYHQKNGKSKRFLLFERSSSLYLNMLKIYDLVEKYNGDTKKMLENEFLDIYNLIYN